LEEEGGLIMKIILIIALSLMLSGCGKAMTRLLPKIEKIDLPEELMVPAKELKTSMENRFHSTCAWNISKCVENKSQRRIMQRKIGR